MIGYSYSETTGEFLSEETLIANPEVEGEWLLPANCTTLQPPTAGKNEVAVFENGAWVVKPDFRGKKVYLQDGSKVEIKDIGPIPQNSSLTKDIVDINVLKKRAMDDIDYECGMKREEFISPGSFIVEEYRLAEDEARRWLSSQDTTVPQSIVTTSNVTGLGYVAAAKLILAKAGAFYAVLDTLRDIRLTFKAKIAQAETAAEIDSILVEAKTSINGVSAPVTGS